MGAFGADFAESSFSPRLVAVRITLAATEADLRGAWDDFTFFTDTVSLLPDPSEVAWAAMYLTCKNLALLDPPPEPADLAAAGTTTAFRSNAPAGAAQYTSIVLATAARSVAGVGPPHLADLLVTSTGQVLVEDSAASLNASAGLFSAVAYSFVRSALHLGTDPLETVDTVRRSLPG
jgi:hypothetical protein